MELNKLKKRFFNWWNSVGINSVTEFKKYKIIVKLIDGGVAECESTYYIPPLSCSFSKYIVSMSDKGISIEGKFYSYAAIKSVEDEIIDTKLVCCPNDFYGISGLTIEEIEDNQKEYSNIIDMYKLKVED